MQIHGSKTLKSRQPVPVLSILRGLLEGRLRPPRPDGVAFGVWMLSGNARREILTACRRAEIAPATWNDLRRTHGRWPRRAGVSVELIGEQLRHTSPAMARRVYATTAPDELGADRGGAVSAYRPSVRRPTSCSGFWKSTTPCRLSPALGRPSG